MITPCNWKFPDSSLNIHEYANDTRVSQSSHAIMRRPLDMFVYLFPRMQFNLFLFQVKLLYQLIWLIGQLFKKIYGRSFQWCFSFEVVFYFPFFSFFLSMVSQWGQRSIYWLMSCTKYIYMIPCNFVKLGFESIKLWTLNPTIIHMNFDLIYLADQTYFRIGGVMLVARTDFSILWRSVSSPSILKWK